MLVATQEQILSEGHPINQYENKNSSFRIMIFVQVSQRKKMSACFNKTDTHNKNCAHMHIHVSA
jgi:hypothetical protein